MLAKTLSIVAVLAFAAQTSAAKPAPYKPQPQLMRMSVHEMFGIGRRQSSGYQPTQSVCGAGDTCTEACGDGYTTCPSNDDLTHCYDEGANQTCCPDNSGNSCDVGYYCAADNQHGTWCCPDGMSLAACAAAYSVTGSLISETPTPTSTSISSTSTTSIVPTTTAVNTTSIVIPTTSSSIAIKTTITALLNSTVTTSCSESVAPSVTLPASNATVAIVTTTHEGTTGPTTTPAQVPVSGASANAPAVLAILAAGALAALL